MDYCRRWLSARAGGNPSAPWVRIPPTPPARARGRARIIAPVLKTGRGKTFVGSNPTASANAGVAQR